MPRIHKKNKTNVVGLNKVAKDPRIVEVWSEDNGPRGRETSDYWADLKKGWLSDMGTSVLHEYSVEDMELALMGVEPCGCEGSHHGDGCSWEGEKI